MIFNTIVIIYNLLFLVLMLCLRYLTDLGNLQNHVSRLNNRGEGESVAVNTLKIQVQKMFNSLRELVLCSDTSHYVGHAGRI